MSASRTDPATARLAHHGLAYRMRGFPIYVYDDDGERIYTGVIDEPLWKESDLTDEQRAELDAEVAEELGRRPWAQRESWTPERIRAYMLEWEGVEHDQHIKAKPIRDNRPAIGYVCAICDSWIVNDNPDDSPFVGGPLDGRWIVTDGRPAYDCLVPNEDFRPALIGGPDLAMRRVTYYRDPHGTYRLAHNAGAAER